MPAGAPSSEAQDGRPARGQRHGLVAGAVRLGREAEDVAVEAQRASHVGRAQVDAAHARARPQRFGSHDVTVASAATPTYP